MRSPRSPQARACSTAVGEARGREIGLAVDVEDAARGAHRESGQQHAFEQQVRIALHQVAVLEDPGLALLAVHHDELGCAPGRAAALPLHRRLEVRAAPSLEAGRAHLVDHALRLGLVAGHARTPRRRRAGSHPRCRRDPPRRSARAGRDAARRAIGRRARTVPPRAPGRSPRRESAARPRRRAGRPAEAARRRGRTATAGAAQHAPLQPPATADSARPRRAISRAQRVEGLARPYRGTAASEPHHEAKPARDGARPPRRGARTWAPGETSETVEPGAAACTAPGMCPVGRVHHQGAMPKGCSRVRRRRRLTSSHRSTSSTPTRPRSSCPISTTGATPHAKAQSISSRVTSPFAPCSPARTPSRRSHSRRTATPPRTRQLTPVHTRINRRPGAVRRSSG